MKKINLLFAFLVVCCSVYGQLPPLPPRPAVDPALAPFYHGVASGDPLSDRVIIWTRVTPTVFESVTVSWQMATDTLFTHLVGSGTATTDSSLDYTVKVDVTGLNPDTWYYYRFKSGSAYSIAGRTKTLPVGNADSIRLAIFSCSDFQSGYFNAFRDIARRNDLSAILHLGDWYYEYMAAGSDNDGDTSRYHPLTRDAYTLGDYRLWYSQYRLDDDTRAMMEQYPMISIWDDHESANNSWFSGAQNHNTATQGSWFVRKDASRQAYFEWNPIRPATTGNDTTIYRNFKFGDLFNLIMLDTRLEGRDSSLGSFVAVTNAYMSNTGRHMVTPTQMGWIQNQLSDTSTRWRVLGNQVMMAPLTLDVLLTTEVINGDQWDGYPAERNRLFNYISANSIKDVVVVSGDIHSSWASDMPGADSTYVSATGAGSVATEMIGSSITSTADVPSLTSTISAADAWFKYINFELRGYLLFDVNKTRIQGDYIHISGDSTKTFTTSDDAQWMNLDGEKHLRVSTPLGTQQNTVPLVSPFPVGASSGVQQIKKTDLIVFTCYPNPAENEVNVQYYLDHVSCVEINITDINGRVVYHTNTNNMPQGMNVATISIAGFTPGLYNITLSCGNSAYTGKVVKMK